ncbi:MAG: flippase-like domain-containing protein [Chloroflexota bacterium]|nr:flippase-like domain-containing protein [Chloroflexota bacterium]
MPVDTAERTRPPALPTGDEESNGTLGGERSFGRSWRVWAGVLISGVLLVYAFQGQSPAEIWDALRRFDSRWLLPALVLYFAGVWIRAVRWAVLLRPLVPVSVRDVLPIVVVGYTANNVLPLRTGELVRAYLVRRRFGVRKTAALATIAVERLFDGLTMLGFIFAATTVISLTAALQHLALIAAAVFAAILLGMVVLTLGGDFRDRLLQLALGPLPPALADRVERMAMSFLGGLGVLRRKGDLGLVGLTSIAAWGFEASMYWALARGFGGEVAAVMSVPAALLTTGVANLATLVPAAPGYVGTFEAGVTLAVTGALGVSRGLALSYAILVHAVLWFPITAAGAFVWWRLHLSVRQARQYDDETEGRAAPVKPRPARPRVDE